LSSGCGCYYPASRHHGRVRIAEHAEVIRALGKRVVHDIIEIGRRLIDAKKIAGHGGWLPWLDREFGWEERTARNFIAVAEAAGKSAKFADLDVPVSGLYLLAAPSTPAEVIEAVAERSDRGERAFVADRKERVDLTIGQRAMQHAMLWPEPEKGGRGKKLPGKPESLSRGHWSDLVSHARAVFAYSRPLAEEVRDGTKTTLDAAMASRPPTSVPARSHPQRRDVARASPKSGLRLDSSPGTGGNPPGPSIKRLSDFCVRKSCIPF